jgi:hypothetical protein
MSQAPQLGKALHLLDLVVAKVQIPQEHESAEAADLLNQIMRQVKRPQLVSPFKILDRGDPLVRELEDGGQGVHSQTVRAHAREAHSIHRAFQFVRALLNALEWQVLVVLPLVTAVNALRLTLHLVLAHIDELANKNARRVAALRLRLNSMDENLVVDAFPQWHVSLVDGHVALMPVEIAKWSRLPLLVQANQRVSRAFDDGAGDGVVYAAGERTVFKLHL